MITSKIIIEIRFHQPIPKKLLQELVLEFSEHKSEMIKPMQKIDPSVNLRIWYEDVRRMSSLDSSDFLKIFRREKNV